MDLFVLRCYIPAYSSSNLPHHWRHSGFLHGPGTNSWNGCARVHWSTFFRDLCFVLFMCQCLCEHVYFGSVPELEQLGVSCFAALFHLVNLNTHRPTTKTNILWHVMFFAKQLFSCVLTSFFDFLLTANWATCSTGLLVSWVPTLSLWLRQWCRNWKFVQRHGGSWYTLCKFQQLLDMPRFSRRTPCNRNDYSCMYAKNNNKLHIFLSNSPKSL